MSTKKILIIDDLDIEREQLEQQLKGCRFEVFTARNGEEARREAEMHWAEVDVVILDNNLNGEPMTGPEIAMEFRHKAVFPPESIIWSVMDYVDFYRIAIQLGAAAYLDRREVGANIQTLVDHVKVLALRRALNPANPDLVVKIARIAAQGKNEPEAIMKFCGTVLNEEIKSCCPGMAFVLLLTQGKATRNCADDSVLPADSLIYPALQEFAQGNLTEPQVLQASSLGPPPDETFERLFSALDRGVFLPLASANDMQLSIGILKTEPDSDRQLAGRASLARIFAQYFRPTVLASIGSIWAQWGEVHAIRSSTAKLCLAVGQEITYGVATDNDEQLQDLANDLSYTGQYLDQIGDDKVESVSIREVIDTAWKYVAPFGENAVLETPQMIGSCQVMAQKSGLELAVSRLLQWFIHRSKNVPLNVKPAIRINCETDERATRITFQDNSHRLPKTLREGLFAPFTQAISTPFPPLGNLLTARGRKRAAGGSKTEPGRYLPLYLAKFLVESRYRGRLEDHSDEIIEHTYGNRILMQFPAGNLG